MTVNGTVVNIADLLAELGMEYIGNISIKVSLEKDGTGKSSYVTTGLSIDSPIEWEFNDSKESIKIREKDEDSATGWSEWSESEIIRLTNKECWMQDTEIEDGTTYTTLTKFEKE
ncbi:MAG: hypothetical protein RBR97_03335 [Bacteroidales bacterium]|nr:hypothetical protein [Bacteroidales bacterium]